MQHTAFFTALALTISSGAYAQASATDLSTAATQALSAIRELKSFDAYSVAGFDWPEQAQLATTGTPIPIKMIRADQLGAFQTGNDPHGLLVDLKRVFVPILVGQEVKSSVELTREGGNWRVMTIGKPQLTSYIETTRATLVTRANQIAGAQFLVLIPALYRQFIGYDTAAGLVLTDPLPASTAVGSASTYTAIGKATTATPTSAARVFADLAPAALAVARSRP